MPIQQVSTLNHPYQSLAAMFQDRVVRTPDRDAYLQYCSKQSRWESFSWRQISNKAARAQGWLGSLGLSVLPAYSPGRLCSQELGSLQ